MSGFSVPLRTFTVGVYLTSYIGSWTSFWATQDFPVRFALMMATFFQSVRQGFNRQSNRSNGNVVTSQQRPNGSQNPSPTAFSPNMPPLTQSPSLSSTIGSENGHNGAESPVEAEPTKFFFREKYARLGVKGNFMPLAAQPKNVDLGEWLAHQAVEQYRLVEALLQCIQEVDVNTGTAICNPKTCPFMSAGRSHTYTWLNNEKAPIRVPANQYISLVQRWIVGKIHDPKAFPTESPNGLGTAYASGSLSTSGASTPIAMGPTTLSTPLSTLAGRDWVGKSAGFPESFFGDCKTIFRQIFRLYAHLYHSHWENPFWHMTNGTNSNGWTDLNSCFVHYISVAKLFGLLSEKDTEPLQPLIDIWIGNGSVPQDAANGACTIVAPQ
ncbi:hypothetical protein MMC12_002675 [Toensbergia leucococca]|nr:hypothetical protein [Toensbergia leucococca]